MRIVLSIVTVVLVVASSARGQKGTSADASPRAVVQRFVDAGNAHDAEAMAALVAADAVFARFPGGEVIAGSRDRIREHYVRQLQAPASEVQIVVQSRIVEGQFVIDQEHITGLPGGPRQSTWMYLVRDGLIRRAWVLDAKATPGED
jgi:uncharacterized protein (TIGR02246 family)